MSQSLNVLPWELFSIARMLTQSVGDATTSVTKASGPAVPVPADATSVSIAAAESFARYVPEYLQAAADGLVKLTEAAAALPQIAQSYITTDEGGAALLQMAASGLGPLTGVLGTIPQMAEAAAVTEEDGGDDVSDQGATFV